MTSLDELSVIQHGVFAQLENFVRNFKKSSKERLENVGYIRGRLECLTGLCDTFNSNDLKIRCLPKDEKHEYFTGDLVDNFMDLSSEYQGILIERLSKLTTPSHVPSGSVSYSNRAGPDEAGVLNVDPMSINRHIPGHSNSEIISNEIRLPHITIPTFAGDYDSWLSFYDIFDSMVNSNPRLSPVQKMHYLKVSLAGEAEGIIRHLPVTSDNYSIAWNKLVQRYQNPRVLVNKTLKRFFSQGHIQVEAALQIRRILDITNECLSTLANLKVEVAHWDPIIIFFIQERLPPETRQLWEQKQGHDTALPQLSDLQDFLEVRFRTLEALSSQKSGQKSSTTPPERKTRTYNTTQLHCQLCQDSHALKACSKFLAMQPQERYRIVASKSLCFNCLAHSHQASRCPSKYTCRQCKRRHNSLLHMTNKTPSTSDKDKTEVHNPTGQTTQPTVTASTTKIVSCLSRENKMVILATLLIKASTPNREPIVFRALMDPGSQTTFISKRAAQLLHVGYRPFPLQVAGLGNTITAKTQSAVLFSIQPYLSVAPSIEVTAAVLDTLTDFLPPKRLPMHLVSQFKNLTLADPTFDRPGKIDVVLGAEIYARILESGVIHGPADAPTAQKTSFGWILFGEIRTHTPYANPPSKVTFNFCSQIDECDAIKRFWELEEVSTSKEVSEDETLCERHFCDTHSRTVEGRYIVHLPFVSLPDNEVRFGNSREVALKRFQSLERRLNTDPRLKEDYNKCLEEYLEQGHMEKVAASEVSQPPEKVFYLPHHAVVKEDSLTTRTRVVFDASSKSTNGYSLNDRLLPGPPLQRDISLLLTEWRQHKFVFTADIARMYRQILVHPTERDLQRIIWRSSSDESPSDYRLLTVTFGVTSAPFLAMRVLHQLSRDEGHDLPKGAQILMKDLYVDDVLSGGATLEETREARRQIDTLLQRGKFELRKWASNSEQVLADIPETDRSTSSSLVISTNNQIKTLGLHWSPTGDCFSYHLQLAHPKPPFSKRVILSEIARIYDPLGWLAPITITAKIFMQSLWQQGIGWDESIPTDLETRWKRYLGILNELNVVSIPRFVHIEPTSTVQLHGFCDASERAYGAVLYLRSETKGRTHVNLLVAKTKVAPVKSITLPRLELCGAVLLSRLIKKFRTSIRSTEIRTVLWTDSTIVLHWIKGHPNTFKTFVSNRVSEIVTNLKSTNSWRHVRSAENPADLASRGASSFDDFIHPFWWQGPSWLSQSESSWPDTYPPGPEPQLLEVRKTKTFISQSSRSDEDPTYWGTVLERYSSLSRLLRVTVLCRRFISACSRKITITSSSPITAAELKSARVFWIRYDQRKFFSEEINSLMTGEPLPPKSSIISLNPFVDDVGLLRVGGRLQNASIPYSEKHPLILHPKSHLTHLWIDSTHKACLHGGPTLTLATLRKTIWVVKGRRVVQSLIRKCIPCFKNSCRTQSQLMGALPSPRITPSRPFTHVGIDYAGPFHLRISRTRGCRTYKGYVVIFICLCTKAIHIEVVSDLTTDAFLACLKRFTARRGLCQNIYSDCGTTFVGARNSLDRELAAAYVEAIRHAAEHVSIQGIQWNFIPPASPHFGGLWEAGVKSIKYHLKRVIGNTSLTFEEMYTLLTQVESCLNSRPLCPLTDDLNDLRVLTPGHFLIGDALIAPPEEELLTSKVNALTRWNLIQRAKQDFWRSWNKEYLSRLQQRPKWLKASPNLEIGNLVLIKNENLKPNQWALGRVSKTYPGSDQLVRVVTVRTQNGELTRPVTKLCLLPVNTSTDPNQDK